MKQFLSRAAGLFFMLCMVFIPFAYRPLQQGITECIFDRPVRLLRSLLFNDAYGPIEFSSDTRSLLLLIFLLAIIGAALAWPLQQYHQKLLPALKTATVYFLAFVLLKYGLDKIFLRQFYTPAPNILYTPLGSLDRDILYWSTIGIAPSYQIVLGITEVLAALLLLISRTRFMGLLLTIITLVQVVIINFTFDISVKMFSLLLLAMAVYAAWPQLKALFIFLLTQKASALPKQETIAIPVYVKAGLKCFAIGLMLLYGFTSQISMRVPHSLTGAYKVDKYEVNGKPTAMHSAPVKHVFVHPKHYIIFQAQDDTMADYYFTPQSTGNSIELLGYNGQRQKLSFTKEEGKLVLRFTNGTVITATPLPWQKMPALKPQFHFTIDGIE